MTNRLWEGPQLMWLDVSDVQKLQDHLNTPTLTDNNKQQPQFHPQNIWIYSHLPLFLLLHSSQAHQMHHGRVHVYKVTPELIRGGGAHCLCDRAFNSTKRKTTAAPHNTKVHSAEQPTHTRFQGGVCVFACRRVCACLDTIKTSSWRRVPMHHPDDSGQAAGFAAADIELNDVVLHCGCRGRPAHH